MLERDSIDPIISFGVNRCPNCQSILTVVDMETTFLELADNGSPINETTMVKSQVVCRNCGYSNPVIRDGLSYIYDNEYNRLDRRYREECHNREVAKRMDALKPSKDNPFCINVKEQA